MNRTRRSLITLTFGALAAIATPGVAHATEGHNQTLVTCAGYQVGVTASDFTGPVTVEPWGDLTGQPTLVIFPGESVTYGVDRAPGTYAGGFNLSFANGKTSSPPFTATVPTCEITPSTVAQTTTTTSTLAPTTGPTTVPPTSSVPVTILPVDCNPRPLPAGCHEATVEDRPLIPGWRERPTTTIASEISTAVTLPRTGAGVSGMAILASALIGLGFAACLLAVFWPRRIGR